MADVDRKVDLLTSLPSSHKQGRVIIFSAPSGSGKTTIVKHLLKRNPLLAFSISACTRSPRDYEVEGTHYYFLSEQEFVHKIEQGEFIEWQQVYPGCYYGTLQAEIRRLWGLGKHVLFDVDVKGGLNLKDYFKEDALAIFVAPPSYEELEQRLRKRDTESEERIRERLAKAKYEMSFQTKFEKVILNDNLEQAVDEAQRSIDEFLSKEV